MRTQISIAGRAWLVGVNRGITDINTEPKKAAQWRHFSLQMLEETESCSIWGYNFVGEPAWGPMISLSLCKANKWILRLKALMFPLACIWQGGCRSLSPVDETTCKCDSAPTDSQCSCLDDPPVLYIHTARATFHILCRVLSSTGGKLPHPFISNKHAHLFTDYFRMSIRFCDKLATCLHLSSWEKNEPPHTHTQKHCIYSTGTLGLTAVTRGC